MHFTAAGNEWMRLTVAWISFVLVDLEPALIHACKRRLKRSFTCRKIKKNTNVMSTRCAVCDSIAF